MISKGESGESRSNQMLDYIDGRRKTCQILPQTIGFDTPLTTSFPFTFHVPWLGNFRNQISP